MLKKLKPTATIGSVSGPLLALVFACLRPSEALVTCRLVSRQWSTVRGHWFRFDVRCSQVHICLTLAVMLRSLEHRQLRVLSVLNATLDTFGTNLVFPNLFQLTVRCKGKTQAISTALWSSQFPALTSLHVEGSKYAVVHLLIHGRLPATITALRLVEVRFDGDSGLLLESSLKRVVFDGAPDSQEIQDEICRSRSLESVTVTVLLDLDVGFFNASRQHIKYWRELVFLGDDGWWTTTTTSAFYSFIADGFGRDLHTLRTRYPLTSALVDLLPTGLHTLGVGSIDVPETWSRLSRLYQLTDLGVYFRPYEPLVNVLSPTGLVGHPCLKVLRFENEAGLFAADVFELLKCLSELREFWISKWLHEDCETLARTRGREASLISFGKLQPI